MVDYISVEQKIVNYFKENLNLQVLNSKEFEQEREAFIFLIGLEDIVQVNFGLKDYSLTFSGVLDCFIDEDKDGSLFNDYTLQINRLLFNINKDNFTDIFGELPVVGFLPDIASCTLTDDSNRYTVKFTIITSEV